MCIVSSAIQPCPYILSMFPVKSLYNWPAEYIQTSSGECPLKSIECLTFHPPVTKTYKRQFLASPTECLPEELLGSASELLWLEFSQTCSESSFTLTLSLSDETFVPHPKRLILNALNIIFYSTLLYSTLLDS